MLGVSLNCVRGLDAQTQLALGDRLLAGPAARAAGLRFLDHVRHGRNATAKLSSCTIRRGDARPSRRTAVSGPPQPDRSAVPRVPREPRGEHAPRSRSSAPRSSRRRSAAATSTRAGTRRPASCCRASASSCCSIATRTSSSCARSPARTCPGHTVGRRHHRRHRQGLGRRVPDHRERVDRQGRRDQRDDRVEVRAAAATSPSTTGCRRSR